MEGLILNLVSGAVGGNVVERLIGSPNQGTFINSIAGILGGGLGGSILGMLGAPDMAEMAGDAAEMDIVALLGQVGQRWRWWGRIIGDCWPCALKNGINQPKRR